MGISINTTVPSLHTKTESENPFVTVCFSRNKSLIFHQGKTADTYNIGGFNEWKNIDIIKVVIKTVDRLLGRKEGIEKTVRWYLDNQAWMDNVTSGDYQMYYEDMYKDR